MLLREESGGLIALSQPAHSWLAGQLAQHWGNRFFGSFAPREEVLLAAALHDIGYLEWEESPSLNPANGLPHCFNNMPEELHFELWAKSVRKLMRYGRYPALLVSLHFTGLCRKHHKSKSPDDLKLEQNFLSEQEAFQSTLKTSLQNDFHYAPCVGEVVQRNGQLLSVWDWMSLSLCLGFGQERVIPDVPDKNGLVSLKLTRLDSSRVGVEPWPFCEEKPLLFVCEGRRLLGRFTDETRMREALRAGAPVAVRFELVPPPVNQPH